MSIVQGENDAEQLRPASRESPLLVVNRDADDRFRALAREMSLDPDDAWLGGYADYAWNRTRRIFDSLPEPIAGKRVLEFGCNFGATSITLARLRAHVVGIDISASYLALAQVNAARYGVSDTVEFRHVDDTRRLPFPDEHFDVITCCSVLEYVPYQILAEVQRELDRVLRVGGVIVVAGTSNRLWPREVHSRQWLVNYLPTSFDRWLPSAKRERGVLPWHVRRGFGPHYENIDRTDDGRAYFAVKRSTGTSRVKCAVLAASNRILGAFGVSIGLATPSIFVRLRKRSIASRNTPVDS